MKFTPKKGYNGSVCKVWDDDKEVCYGVIGTVEDLLQVGILDFAAYYSDTWAFLPAPGIIHKPCFAMTKAAALADLPR